MQYFHAYLHHSECGRCFQLQTSYLGSWSSSQGQEDCGTSLTFSKTITFRLKLLQPTVQFYGQPHERRITTTENERVDLPLRLTGDGVRNLYTEHSCTSDFSVPTIAMAR